MRKSVICCLALAVLLVATTSAFAGAPGEGDPSSRFGAIKWLRTMYAKADFIEQCADFYFLDSRDYLRLKNDLNRWSTPVVTALTLGMSSPDPITIEVGAWTEREAEAHGAVAGIRAGVDTLKTDPDYKFDERVYQYLDEFDKPLNSIEKRLTWITNEISQPSDCRNYEMVRDWASQIDKDANKIKSLIKRFASHIKVKLFSVQY